MFGGETMAAYVLRRLLQTIPALFIVVTIIFILTHVVPGDPVGVMLGPFADQDRIEETRKRMGLDRPVIVQYVEWLSQAVRGDFGDSFFLGRPVSQAIREAFPVTASLALLSIILTVLLAVPLGIISALKRDSLAANATMVFSVLGISIPDFWLGFLLIMLFAVQLGWLPTFGYKPLSEGLFTWLRYLTLPVITISLSQMALVTRMTRAGMLEVLDKDYIRTAYAKGLSPSRIVLVHALRNAFVSILTVIGLSFAIVLGGALIIETVFALPGMGRLVVAAATRRDYPVIQGVVVYLSLIYMLVNLVVDIAYGWINPRIRYE
jgi:peptide/nickel transport system permease protein